MAEYRNQNRVIIRGYFETEEEHEMILQEFHQFAEGLPQNKVINKLRLDLFLAICELLVDADEFKSIKPLKEVSHVTNPEEWFVGDFDEFLKWKNDQERYKKLISELPTYFFIDHVAELFWEPNTLMRYLIMTGNYNGIRILKNGIFSKLGKTFFL